MDKVQVLLSAYNGEKYIAQQIESILSQKEVDVSCLVRDDGSEDSTVRIVRELEKNDSRVHLECGANEGWKRGFYRLVNMADQAPFYAFADQDDVWLDWKLKRAVDKIKVFPQEEPCLYYSNVFVTDDALQIINEKVNISPPKNKESALNICYGQGCTMVFNLAAKELFTQYQIKEPISHECWMAILCIYFGNVIYDNVSTLLYRQHEGNSIGSGKKTRLQLLREKFCGEQAYYPYYRYLSEGYGNLLKKHDRKILEDFMNYKNDRKAKKRLLWNPNIKRYTFSGTLSLKMAILQNRI